MRRPRDLQTGDRSPVPTPTREVPNAGPTWHQQAVQLFRQGLFTDPASEAAGEAFLAISWLNRRSPTVARQHAAAAALLNPAVWTVFARHFEGAAHTAT